MSQETLETIWRLIVGVAGLGVLSCLTLLLVAYGYLVMLQVIKFLGLQRDFAAFLAFIYIRRYSPEGTIKDVKVLAEVIEAKMEKGGFNWLWSVPWPFSTWHRTIDDL